MSRDIVSQAGGIAFRGSGRDLTILLVTSKKQPGFWIFPKGHVERGETAAQAGVRETRRKPASPAICSARSASRSSTTGAASATASSIS